MKSPRTLSAAAVLLLAATIGAGGCTAQGELGLETSDATEQAPPGGKYDGPGEQPLSAELASLLVSRAFLEVLDQMTPPETTDPMAARHLLVTQISEESLGTATLVRARVESAASFVFPSGKRLEGFIEAEISSADGLRVERVDVLTADPGMSAARTLSPEQASFWGDPRARSVLRGLASEGGEVTLDRLREERDDAGAALILHLRAAADAEPERPIEVVSRFAECVECATRPDSTEVYENGIVLDDVIPSLGGWQFFPGNGFFAYDDSSAFLQEIWSGYSQTVRPHPAPYLSEGEAVVGVVTHYTPFIAKNMSIESVDDSGPEVIVTAVITWNGFNCFEATGDLHLYDMVKVKSGDRPIVLQIWKATGEGCDTGIHIDPLPPTLAHEIRLEPTHRNGVTLCHSSGNFNDPPFGTECQPLEAPPGG